jgi:hypothetical protein
VARVTARWSDFRRKLSEVALCLPHRIRYSSGCAFAGLLDANGIRSTAVERLEHGYERD